MFDPSIGRWLEEDPDLFTAGDPDLYRYCDNDPTNANDPSGLFQVLISPSPMTGEMSLVETIFSQASHAPIATSMASSPVEDAAAEVKNAKQFTVDNCPIDWKTLDEPKNAEVVPYPADPKRVMGFWVNVKLKDKNSTPIKLFKVTKVIDDKGKEIKLDDTFMFNCHAFSIGAWSNPDKARYAVPDDKDIKTILKQAYTEIDVSKEKLQLGDIVVMGDVKHSCVIAKPVYDGDKLNEAKTVVVTKNGENPLGAWTLKELKVSKEYGAEEFRPITYYRRKK